MNLRRLLNLACDAVMVGGGIASRYFRKMVRVEQKSKDDFVSEIDIEVERAIKAILSGSGIPVYGEEMGGDLGDSYWLVDPIDGTTNFIRGVPVYAVSVALIVDGEPAVGVVYNPEAKELFWAGKGMGAHLWSRRIRVSGRQRLEGALIATGFPFRKKHLKDTYLAMFGEVFSRVADLRRKGAAAIDLAYVALGVYDGFFEFGLNPWDIAAGILLVLEAGGRVDSFDGSDVWETGNIIAAGGVFDELKAILRRGVDG